MIKRFPFPKCHDLRFLRPNSNGSLAVPLRRRSFWICVSFGMSLGNIFFRFPLAGQSVTLAVSDAVVAVLLFYALFRVRIAVRNSVVFAFLYFVVIVLISGILNVTSDPTFDGYDFALDYLRLSGLLGMLVLLPTVMRRVGNELLVMGTLWAVRFHCLYFVLDTFFVMPVRWASTGVIWSPVTPEFSRPVGLFGEPSFFAVFVILSLFFVLQVEVNSKRLYIRTYDIVLISLGLLASTALSSLVVLNCFFIALIVTRDMKHRVRVGASATVFCVLAAVTVSTAPDIGRESMGDYMFSRAKNIRPGQFSDSSSRQRIIGSTLLAVEVLKDAPMFGKGMGGQNTNRLFLLYPETVPARSAPLSTTIVPAQVVASSGFLGLLAILWVYIATVNARRSRLMGLSFLVSLFLWGGAFEPVFWWFVCLSVAISGGQQLRWMRKGVSRSAAAAVGPVG